MHFDQLNEKNYLMFAIQHYDNPQSVTVDDFMEDMKKFKYLKRLLKRYLKTGVLRVNLILNHLIVLFNVFGEGTIPLLMYKLEREYWSLIKTFLVYLNRYPQIPAGSLDLVDTDYDVKELLEDL
ncbi:MAG: hypothetical protein CBC89_06415 [Euryarchaeota archaeon TMED129]|nr:MAG: hypothetical protein CBC89_06415 [Euryarchaeota archaeon TMED129]|tara:strand:- start:439 stop:810 length:372 start_codon:yes stop_codon:yes gene_type:complete